MFEFYYLSGSIVDFRHKQLGFMMTPQMGNQTPCDAIWAADNGRFNAPEKYTDESYLAWLCSRPCAQHCIFATAPDVVGDHDATVAMSLPLFKPIREAGYRPAFVAQDGWRDETTPWDKFDVLFIGGTTQFKLATGLLAGLAARRRKKWVHMGRVNSFRRLAIAKKNGCHSADGTFLKYGRNTNIPRMLEWFRKLESVQVEVA